MLYRKACIAQAKKLASPAGVSAGVPNLKAPSWASSVAGRLGAKLLRRRNVFFSMPTFARDSIGEHAASATCFRVLVSWAVLCHQRTKSRTDCFIACCIDCRLAQCLLLRLGHCGSYRSRAPLSVRKNTAATAATVALKTPCFDLIDVGLLILASNVTDLANHRQMNQS